MAKKVIAIDIDDVLSSQTERLIEFSNKRYGTALTRDDFKAAGEYWTYYEQVLHSTHDEAERRFQEFLDAKEPLKQHIEAETLTVLHELKERYRLEIVTARRMEFHEGTLEWLNRQAAGLFDGIHFIRLWDTPDKEATKAQICQEIGAGYLIDDNAEHCDLAAKAGVQCLLFGEWGWNVDYKLPSGVVRVKDWQEVKRYFDGQR